MKKPGRAFLTYALAACLFMTSLEAFMRWKHGFSIFSPRLQKSGFWRDEALYKWNLKFPENKARSPQFSFEDPRYERLPYLYRENLRLVEQAGRFQPGREGDEITFSTNNLGLFGSPDAEAQKSPNTFRIFLLGASTTEFILDEPGGGVQGLIDRLRESGLLRGRRQVEFLNASIAGTKIEDHVEQLKFQVSDLKPDAVIYQWAPRDEVITNILITDCLVGWYRNPKSCWLAGQGAIFRFLYTHSVLFLLAEESTHLFRRASPEPPLSSAGSFDYLRDFNRRLKELARYARDHGIYLILSEQNLAYHHLEDRAIQNHPLLRAQLEKDFFPLTAAQIRGAFHEVNKTISAAAKEMGIFLCKKPEPHELSPDFFADYIHLRNKYRHLLEAQFAKCLASDPKFRMAIGNP